MAFQRVRARASQGKCPRVRTRARSARCCCCLPSARARFARALRSACFAHECARLNDAAQSAARSLPGEALIRSGRSSPDLQARSLRHLKHAHAAFADTRPLCDGCPPANAPVTGTVRCSFESAAVFVLWRRADATGRVVRKYGAEASISRLRVPDLHQAMRAVYRAFNQRLRYVGSSTICCSARPVLLFLSDTDVDPREKRKPKTTDHPHTHEHLYRKRAAVGWRAPRHLSEVPRAIAFR